ncbi:hypothetical protein TNIN_19341 [Trichonephila inaurata madagascariensis]|uniref:Uncharacterized protein n=1 Tax=Trichonephila inaurata madagascariensis TaxID=2747483 RepID=A0A8X7C397_9ARAC|nr:hypothetical protein TNIN_19341 [Trichonephila inaurata madagascariensis]
MFGLETLASGSPRYERCREYPDNGARTTRCALMAFFVFTILGIVIPVFIITTKLEIFFILAITCYVITIISFIVVLWRTLSYHRFLRRQEASGIPFDPEKNLSITNYIRKLIFLPPEGYSSSQMPPQIETQNIELMERNQ